MITIQKVQLKDADTLLSFSKKTFYHFFGPLNDNANMDAYASTAFTHQRMLEELSNANSEFYFVMDENLIAGYLKLNFNDAQNEFKESDAMEIERIYVSEDQIGKGVGKQLLDFAIDIAQSRQFSYLWLGVWEHNHRALKFYERNGFKVFSSHPFVLGEDKQLDLLMKLQLS
jgi:ribosomal protein S18 acetylase RimI-like enzyme